ncbi:MAG: hypothetical protein V1886_03685 [archaeon]
MKGKKGDMEELQSFIIYIVFVLIIFLVLLAFIRNASTGTLAKQQILAKEIALLVDSAEPGTEFTVYTENLTVSFKGNKVEVNSKEIAAHPYEYSFSTARQIETSVQGNEIKIKVWE